MTTLLERVAAATPVIRGRSELRRDEWTLPGFGPMTRISASFGEIPAQTLRKRDMVRTQSGQLAEVIAIDRIRLDADFLGRRPDAQAVLIRAGALGTGLPKADIVVSPGQFVALGRHAFDARFVRAGELVGRPGILRKTEELLTYTVFRCAEPVSVRVEGVWAQIDG